MYFVGLGTGHARLGELRSCNEHKADHESYSKHTSPSDTAKDARRPRSIGLVQCFSAVEIRLLVCASETSCTFAKRCLCTTIVVDGAVSSTHRTRLKSVPITLLGMANVALTRDCDAKATSCLLKKSLIATFTSILCLCAFSYHFFGTGMGVFSAGMGKLYSCDRN